MINHKTKFICDYDKCKLSSVCIYFPDSKITFTPAINTTFDAGTISVECFDCTERRKNDLLHN